MKLHHVIASAAVIALTACAAEAPESARSTEPASSGTESMASHTEMTVSDTPSPSEIATSTPAPGVTCAPVEQPPLQSGEHLIGDQEPPVPYNSTPPTSGWHASGAVSIDVHSPDDPLPEPRQVSVLEVGGVVVTYRDLPDDERTRLEEHVRDSHPDRVAVTPYDQLEPGEVAFTAWGTLQRCEGVDLSALDAFVAAHADDDAHGH